MKCRTLFFALLAAGGAASIGACDPDPIHSRVTLDGVAFIPNHCRSGQDAEFYGVDLKDEAGTTLRLAANPDHTITVVVTSGDGRPYSVTGCAELHLDESDRDDKGYYSISGGATLTSCSVGPHTVTGAIDFEDCEHTY